MSVVIETTQGDLTVDLFTKERPKTCLNFLKLCSNKDLNDLDREWTDLDTGKKLDSEQS